jgi:UDP-N-acetylmuramoyl-tripeptide--D-alanyl-D-alanine ligase
VSKNLIFEIMTIPELYSLYLQHPQICTDTRKIISGCMFFALKGDNFNGNVYAKQALELGASFTIIDERSFCVNDSYILVEDVLTTLQNLATYHRKQLKIPVIGLTGSNGKTTTKELINAVLSQKFKTSATVGNLNNHIGVPLTLLAIPADTEIAIVEMGANHQKEIEMLSNICKPNYGLITNVGKAHLEGFGGFEGVKKGKGELYNFLENSAGTLFLNTDNPHLKEMMADKKFKETITYGTDTSNYLSGKLIAYDPFLSVEWHSGQITSSVKSNLTGSYNFENILVAIAIGLKFGLAADEINTGIANYHPQNSRSQIIKTSHNTVIGDYYNANPSSMLAAIKNINQLKADKKVLILGDMFELGVEAEQEHSNVIVDALRYNINECIFIGKEFVKASKSAQAKFFETTAEAEKYLNKYPIRNALVLLKGSRGMKLENLMNNCL